MFLISILGETPGHSKVFSVLNDGGPGCLAH